MLSGEVLVEQDRSPRGIVLRDLISVNELARVLPTPGTRRRLHAIVGVEEHKVAPSQSGKARPVKGGAFTARVGDHVVDEYRARDQPLTFDPQEII
jgi:hypothetical protein